jgi:hypothetical protein
MITHKVLSLGSEPLEKIFCGSANITLYQASHYFITTKMSFLFEHSPLERDGAQAWHFPAPQECHLYMQII